MLGYVDFLPENITRLLGILVCFGVVFFILQKHRDKLPTDQGREFAVNGALSAGKPRGAGIVFVIVFILCAAIFARLSLEMLLYLLLLGAAMITGYLDDSSRAPWGELKKGLLDLAIAVITAVVFLYYNSPAIEMVLLPVSFRLPVVVFGILTVILIWVSINVTNCSDGVDGLSGTLSIVTIMTFFFLNEKRLISSDENYYIILFAAALIAYLWFNSTPSLLMMGDAGSRAMGFFIAVAALKSGDPFIYIPVAIVLILDGGLGLIKVSLLRYLKISTMENIRTPLHDHVRKNKDWSNTQTVFRFVIIQVMVSLIVVYLCR